MVKLAILMLAVVLNMSAQCAAMCGALPHNQAKQAPAHSCHTQPEEQQQAPEQDAACGHPGFVSEERGSSPSFAPVAVELLPVMGEQMMPVAFVQRALSASSPPVLRSAPLSLRI